MLTIYPAIFHEEDGTFWVEFPDLEGCQTIGKTLEQAMGNAQEALGLYLVALEEENIKINPPSDIRKIKTNSDLLVSFVSCEISKYRRNNKAVKKTLTIPSWLNEAAEKQNINFSSLLQKALIDRIEDRRQ